MRSTLVGKIFIFRQPENSLPIALQAEKENQPTEILTLFILKYIADTAIEMIESVHLSNRVRNRLAAP